MSPPPTRPSPRRYLTILLVVACGLAACSGSDDAGRDPSGRITEAGSVSVFDLRPGDCLPLTDDDATELGSVKAIPCDEPHVREVYAVVEYEDEDGKEGGAFPGGEALTTFADAACADRFADYVGVDYLDSSLFITYLLPNLEGWDQGPDHSVVCLTTTTGGAITGSSEGSAR